MGVNRYDTRVVIVNGRHYYLPRLVTVVATGTYSFRVEHRNGETFNVWGGKASGGASNQWYIDGNGQEGRSDIRCTSLVDALKLLNGM